MEHNINLQLFAEPAADGQQSQQNQQGTDGASTTDAQRSGEQQERTFTQADVDRIVQERLARERNAFRQQLDSARQEGRTEAEQLAQMTQEQREQRRREQAEQALARREAEITRRELRATAIDTLQQRELPRDLADLLDYSSADACNTSIDSVERAFRAAVQEGVDARLKSSSVQLPGPGNQPDYDKMSDAEYYAATLKK